MQLKTEQCIVGENARTHAVYINTAGRYEKHVHSHCSRSQIHMIIITVIVIITPSPSLAVLLYLLHFHYQAGWNIYTWTNVTL